MAFQNLCQKIDVDNLRAKISNFSAMPEMPHLKLPKSMSKLKSRKIFRSSHENVNNNTESPKTAATASVTDYQYQLPAGLPHSTFIDLTPQRISTISSLSHDNRNSYSATYCSAHSIDDDYPSPRQYDRRAPLRPISPIRSLDIPKVSTPDHQHGVSNSYQSLVQRLQKGYKDVSEFRLKHIFAKKTVVRRDTIQVEQYVNSYNEERNRESKATEGRQHKERLEDYRFRFKESRQKSGHSYSISSNESAGSSHKQDTPPLNKPGIAATRFAKVRNPPLSMSEEKETAEDDNDAPVSAANITPNKSTVFAIKEQEQIVKNRMRRLAKYVSSSIDESGLDSEPEQRARRKHAERKRKAPVTPQQSIDSLQRAHKPREETTMDVIKQNIKRFHQSMKRTQPTIVDADNEENTTAPKTRKEKITARLRKFRSHNESLDNVGTQSEPNESKDEQTERSPIRTAFNNKFKNLKKSFKRQKSEADNQTGDEASPEKQTRTGNFIKSLRHMRSKKQMSSNDELDDTENECKPDDTVRKASNFEERFEQARKRTLKKVNEKMQNIRFFHRSQETVPKSEVKQSHQTDDEEDDVDEDQAEQIQEYDPEEEMRQIQQQFASHAVWSSKPLHQSDTNESDSETEYPRVLIHQDTSNFLESTLVIAVTRSPAITPPIAKITEIPTRGYDDDNENDVENEQCATVNHSIFANMKLTAPPRQRRSSDGNTKITKVVTSRRASAAEIFNLNEDPWKVANTLHQEGIGKVKSIDIFDKNIQSGGVSGAFEDFDEALRNEPVLHVPDTEKKQRNFDRESSEDTDAADDDNSSRVTKILRKSPSVEKTEIINAKPSNIYGNSRESLITHLDTDVDEDEDRPPSAAPSPPPSPPPTFSPPPPPRPERRVNNLPNPKINIEFHEDLPPLPRNKPPSLPVPTPEPPKIPERTPSMSKVAKPLVKTSSLRLAYSEQVNPNDVGKVNKLISRFEPTKAPLSQRPRIIPRNLNRNAESYSEDEESLSEPEDFIKQNNNVKANIPTTVNETKVLETKLELDANENPIKYEPKPTLQLDRNSNTSSSFSRPNSEYGSPLEYPSSLIGSAETTPVPDRKFPTANLRIRRSMTKDEDVYHSFDSDEENSYYSISPSGSNRYIVDL